MRYLKIVKVEDLQDARYEDLEGPTHEEEANFYARLGIAIATWQFIEDFLFHIYEQAIGTVGVESLAAAFYATPGFRSRLEILDRAISHSAVAGSLVEDWERIKRKCNRKAQRRNKLTHGIVVFDRRDEHERLYLRPSLSDPQRSPGGWKHTKANDRIGIKEIEDMISGFEALHADLQGFQQQITEMRIAGEASS